MRTEGYQKTLFGLQSAEIETSPTVPFTISQDRYAPNWYYEGTYKFQKLGMTTIGELKPTGEEFECGRFLDQLPHVRRWLRNLERRPDAAFWLPTSTDRFYPDFVAELTDGRILDKGGGATHLIGQSC